jgi:hypothetical protein
MRNVAQGAVFRIIGTFKDVNGSLADPTTVTLRVASEADPTIDDTYTYGATASIVRSSIGVYYFEQDTSDMSGIYDWHMVGSGAVVGTKQGQVYVVPMNPDDESSDCSSSV